MNIVYHHRTQATGAEGVHIAHIIKGMRQLGHTVDVVSPNAQDPTETAGDNPFAKKEGAKAGFLRTLSRKLPQFLFEMLELIYNFSALGKLKKAIKDKQINLIYERQAFFLFAGAKIAKKYNIPFMVEVNEVAGQARVRRQIFVGLAKKIERFIFESADAIFVVSEFLKKNIVELGIDPNKIHVIPNGADETLFDPEINSGHLYEKHNIENDAVVVGFIGWFVAWHNLELLLEVFADVAKEKKVYLLLVGDGVLKEELQRQAKDLGVAAQVIFPGAVEYKGIPQYVNVMDICVIPGSNEYRSPIKMFEYMLMGKAVLAPDYQPITSIIAHGENGLIFQADNKSSMHENLEELIKNKEKRTMLGNQARQKVLSQHLWIHNVQRIQGIYEEIK